MKIKCLECKKVARWMRYTQFMGNHPFCDDHAKKQEDFGHDTSYLGWGEINTKVKKN
jgi:hypothetical protein